MKVSPGSTTRELGSETVKERKPPGVMSREFVTILGAGTQSHWSSLGDCEGHASEVFHPRGKEPPLYSTTPVYHWLVAASGVWTRGTSSLTLRGLNKPPRPGEYAGRGQQALAVRSHLREWEQPSLELIGMGPLLISAAGHPHFCWLSPENIWASLLRNGPDRKADQNKIQNENETRCDQ